MSEQIFDGGLGYHPSSEMPDGGFVFKTGDSVAIVAQQPQEAPKIASLCQYLDVKKGQCALSGVQCSLRVVPEQGDWRGGLCSEKEHDGGLKFANQP